MKKQVGLYKKSWRAGQRVVFSPKPASLMMYSSAPAPNSKGTVVPVSIGTHKVTYLPGPGGGLVYVKWDEIGVLGVSPIDLQVVKTQEQNPVLTAKERRALPASAYADPKNRRFPVNDMEHARAAVGKLNMWFKRGQISEAEYREIYPRIMKAYSKFGLSANKAPLVRMPRVIAGGKKAEQAPRKRAVGENPAPGTQVLKFPMRDKKQARNAIVVLNNMYLKGKVSDDEYRQLYEMVASSWKKFKIKDTPTNELTAKAPAAPNPAKRRLPVIQPYSKEWREGRSLPNPSFPTDRNDPSGMRAIMLRAMAKPNPAAEPGNPNLGMQLAVPEMGIQAESIGKNISSLDPLEYFDSFVQQTGDSDTAMAALEDMASWGVTDEI